MVTWGNFIPQIVVALCFDQGLSAYFSAAGRSQFESRGVDAEEHAGFTAEPLEAPSMVILT